MRAALGILPRATFSSNGILADRSKYMFIGIDLGSYENLHMDTYLHEARNSSDGTHTHTHTHNSSEGVPLAWYSDK